MVITACTLTISLTAVSVSLRVFDCCCSGSFLVRRLGWYGTQTCRGQWQSCSVIPEQRSFLCHWCWLYASYQEIDFWCSTQLASVMGNTLYNVTHIFKWALTAGKSILSRDAVHGLARELWANSLRPQKLGGMWRYACIAQDKLTYSH